jgi:hypothetical protein
MNRPDFIIIGAMKSATSSIHSQLAAHPGIFMSEPKEPNFFSDDAEYERGTEWYGSLFEAAAADDLRGESSTHYTKLPDYPHTVDRMKAALPNAKLIYVMRHPVDRLESHYIHQWSQNVIRCGIEEALDRHPELVDYGRYAFQLEPYFEAFGRDAVLPVFFAALKRHPQRELERIARFVGYEGAVLWDPELGAQNVSSERIRRFAGYGLIVESRPMTALRRALIPQGLRDAFKARLTMKERPTLVGPARSRVQRLFDEDLARLSEWLGVRLDCDNFDACTADRPLNWVQLAQGPR